LTKKKKLDFPFAGPWSDGDASLLCLDTGSWRTARPATDLEKCTYCGLCALYCPPQCMLNRGNYFEANLKYCKGCGICAAECPRGAITMVREE
jgi:pyruvate ferredoxin oxidoreductase delta subunit